ncbi:MAG: hypothetical protein GSR85_02085 [Desulfurococcales archaeon]|nr:hypothetical protein [Desulfurococcales archaeon]
MSHRGDIKKYIIASFVLLLVFFSGSFLDKLDIGVRGSGSDELREAYMLLNMMRPRLVEEYGIINVTKYEDLTYNPLPKYDFIGGNSGSWTIVRGSAVYDADLPDSLKIRVDGRRWNTALRIQGGSQGFFMYSSLDEWKEVLAGTPLMIYGIASSDSNSATSEVDVGIEYSVGGGGCPILFINDGEELVTNMLVDYREVISIQKPVKRGNIVLVINESGDSIVELGSLELYVLPKNWATGYMIVQSGDYKAVYLAEKDKLIVPYTIDIMGNKLQLHIKDVDSFYAILQPKNPLLAIIDKNSVKNNKLLLIIKFRDPGYYVKSDISVKVLSENGFIEVAKMNNRIITESTYGFEIPLADINVNSRSAILVLIESSNIQYVDYISFTSTYKTLNVSELNKAELIYAKLDNKEIKSASGVTIRVNGSLKLVFNVNTEGYPIVVSSGKINRVGDTVVRITRDYTMIGSVVIKHKTSYRTSLPTLSDNPVWTTISSPIVYLPGNSGSINYIRVFIEAPPYSENYIAYLKILLEPIVVTTGYETGTYPYDLVSTGLVGLYYVSKNPLNQQYILYFIAIYERYALFGGYPGQLFDVIDKQNITVGWFTSDVSDPDAYMDFDGLVFYFNDENQDSSSGGYSSVADTVATIAGATGTILTYVAFKVPPNYQTYLAFANIASETVGTISNMLVDDNKPPIYIVPLTPGYNLKYMYMVLDYSSDVSYTVLSEKRIDVKFYSDDLPIYSFIIFNRENPAEYGDFDWEDPDSIIIWLNFHS